MNRIDPSLLSPQMRQQLAMMLNQGMGPRPAPAVDPTITDSAIPGELRAPQMPQPNRRNVSVMPSGDTGRAKEQKPGGWRDILGTIGATLQDTGMALNGGQGNALGNLQAARRTQEQELEALRQQRIGDKSMGSLMAGLSGGGDIRSLLSDPRAAAAIMRDPQRASALMQMFQPMQQEWDTTPREGINPQTGKLGLFLVDNQGKQNWLNAGVADDNLLSPEALAQKLDIAGAGASRQSVEINNPQNTGTNAAYDSVNEQISGAYTDALSAQEINTKLDILAQNMAGAPEGAFANGIVGAQQFLGSLGFNVDENALTSAITSRAGVSSLVLDFMAGAGGARGFTEKETQILIDAFPKLATDNASRQAVIQTLKDVNDRRISAYGNARSRAQSVYEFDDEQMEKFWPSVQPSRIPLPQEHSGEPDGTVLEGPGGARYEVRGGYMVRVP